MTFSQVQDAITWQVLVMLLLAIVNFLFGFVLFSKLFRRNPPGLIFTMFTDDRGAPDFARLAGALALLVLLVATFMAIHDPKHALADSYIGGWFGVLGVSLGAAALGTHGYYRAGGSTDPIIEMDGDDNPPADTKKL